eukprot:1322356-Lingulodinium_polyedra.AAC.1
MPAVVSPPWQQAERRGISRYCVFCAQAFHGEELCTNGRVNNLYRRRANASKGIVRADRRVQH